MPVAGDLTDIKNGDGVGAHERIEAFAKSMRRERLRDVNVGRHGKRVDSRIRAPSGGEDGLLARHALDRFLERLLHRGAMILPLPAHEGPSVIFDGQPPTRHGRIVPFGMSKPRSNSSALICARPARWTLIG